MTYILSEWLDPKLWDSQLWIPKPEDIKWDFGEDKVPIDKPYAYHKPSSRGLESINRLRELFSQVEQTMKEVCPNSRHLSIAITQNEQTAMWAIKAVVFNDPDSEVEQ